MPKEVTTHTRFVQGWQWLLSITNQWKLHAQHIYCRHSSPSYHVGQQCVCSYDAAVHNQIPDKKGSETAWNFEKVAGTVRQRNDVMDKSLRMASAVWWRTRASEEWTIWTRSNNYRHDCQYCTLNMANHSAEACKVDHKEEEGSGKEKLSWWMAIFPFMNPPPPCGLLQNWSAICSLHVRVAD